MPTAEQGRDAGAADASRPLTAVDGGLAALSDANATDAAAPLGDSGSDASVVSDAAAHPGDSGTDASVVSDAATVSPHPLPSPLYGVTVDDITDLPNLTASLKALPHKATTRIVFDEGQAPSYYSAAVPAVGAVSYVMGELLDSQFMKTVTVAAFAQRTSDYLAAFPTGIDIWEIGNEINGNWLGTTADVVAKMTSAFDLVKSAGKTTALTLYGCSDSTPDYDMVTWAKANVPARMLSGLDYVLVSYYAGDCGAPRALGDWPAVFAQLHQLFPNAGVGFGETGDVDTSGKSLQNAALEGPYLTSYYTLQVNVPNYVGGYFWWYFYEEMVPQTKPMFATFATAIK